MKSGKFKFATALLFALVIFFGSVAHADDYGIEKTAGAANLKKSVAGSSDVPGLVGAIVKIALDLTGIIFFALILVAGFRWMTARDNSEVIDKSKDTIEHAVVGLIVVLAAYAITSFIFNSLSATSSSDVSIDDPEGCCEQETACVDEERQSACVGTFHLGQCSAVTGCQ